MPYESAPELSAFFKRMGVPLQVVDDPALGKFVTATRDIFPDVVEEGKPNAGTVLETAALFEESGIASWPMSELLAALEKNCNLLLQKGSEEGGNINTAAASREALIGFCNESLALCFAGNKNTALTLVPDDLFASDASAATTNTTAIPTPFLYLDGDAQNRDVIAAAVLGPRGALRSLRKFHSDLEKEAASHDQALIPISVESIARAIVTAVARFLKALERSVRAQFKATADSSAAEKKVAILTELFGSVASDQKKKDASPPPNSFIASLFEASVRPFNRLVEPPEGSEFEASIKTAEWCNAIRGAIQQNIIDIVKSYSAALICELAASSLSGADSPFGLNLVSGISLAGNSTEKSDSAAAKELSLLTSAIPSSQTKTLTLKSPLLNTSAAPLSQDALLAMLEWVPQVVQGWLNDATIITLLGQMTINSQALTAVKEGLVPSSTADAAVEVVQIFKDDEEENTSESGATSGTIVTKSNIHQRVPIFGAAVFTLQSCFNHSCAPNAEVVPTLPFGMGGHDIIVQAIPKNKRISSKGKLASSSGGGGDDDDEEDDDDENGDNDKKSKKEKEDKKSKKDKKDKSGSSSTKVKPVIKEGEEINITYIPMLYLALEDYVSRRQRLESYFFVCECKRCFRENAKVEKAEAKRKTKEAKESGGKQ